MEPVPQTARAEPDCVDLPHLSRGYAVLTQLADGRLTEVDPGGTVQIGPLRKETGKLLSDLPPNFITTDPDGWADGDYDVLSARSVEVGHSAQGRRYDPLYRTPPAGVDRRHGSVAHVGHQQGHAVGRADHQRQSCGI